MHKNRIVLILIFLFGILINSHSQGVVGGDITWECQGNGEYVFQVKVFRDCNYGTTNTNPIALAVWGHPNVTSISLDFIQKNDLSPSCTASGGNIPITCNNGGDGAIEEAIYRSGMISISGIPPADGWHFTYQNVERSASITNLINPDDQGITLVATMYPTPNSINGECIDSSPTFLQSPLFVSCAGSDIKFNSNIVDADMDSIVVKWGEPLNNFPTGAYNPPINPQLIQFETGYDFTNPTPSTSFNTNNQNTTLNLFSGELIFRSYTTGAFAVKVVIDSYRSGIKNATIEREMVFLVLNCDGNNNAPNIIPPFSGNTSFNTTIQAGELIEFDLIAADLDNLQNGSPQTVKLTASGLMYGNNFTNPNAGCDVTPCATLDNGSPVSGVSGVNTHFSWQTSCDHLVNANGEALEEVPYYFVFKIEDDYCPIPEVNYATVKITVKNDHVLPAPEIKCITTNDNGDVAITWGEVTDNFGVFSGYEINGVNNGTFATITNINTTTFVIYGAGNSVEQFYISTLSGCEGNTRRNSDTISNIFLELNNPGLGEAVLNWNKPKAENNGMFSDYYHIYKEFPANNWMLVDSVTYETTSYSDTITVCGEFINYRVTIFTDFCESKSNIRGDIFEDKIVPDIPIINNVTMDTIVGDITLSWSINSQEDTYGYVVYQTNPFGNLVEIDTVWGRFNTSYTHYQEPGNGPYQYSVAAFDSCYTSNIPPTYQTSAKADPHTTIFLTGEMDVCSRQFDLNWSEYLGFNVTEYRVFAKTNNGPWELLTQTSNTFFTKDVSAGDEMISVIQAVSEDGTTSFSNMDTTRFVGAGQPEMSFLQLATVSGNQEVKIVYLVSLDDGIKRIELEKYNSLLNIFETIDEKELGNDSEIIFYDKEVDVSKYSYTYRTKIIDTCEQILGYSNIGKTIHLNIVTDQDEEKHILQWNGYEDFLGGVLRYEIYRGIDGDFGYDPIAVLPSNIRTYTDYVSEIGDYSDGSICYLVQAMEGTNEFAPKEISYSNIYCGYLPPTIYIPNAFTVGGENPVFKPELRQIRVNDYLFEIIDRSNLVVFSTTDPNEGWDGKTNKNLMYPFVYAKEGVYVYRLVLRDGNNIEVTKTGHVTLLRP